MSKALEDDTFRPLFYIKGSGGKQITPVPLTNGRPRYSLKVNQQLREDMLEGLWKPRHNEPMTLGLISYIANGFLQFMGWSEEHVMSVKESLKPCMGMYDTFNEKARANIIYRLAGAHLHLHAGVVLPLPGAVVTDTWMAVEVTKAELSRKHNDRQLVVLDFHVTAGPTAGSTFTQEFPVMALSHTFKETLKFDKYVELHYQDLFGVQLMAYMSYTDDQEVQFTQIATNGHQDKLNRKLKMDRREDCHNETPYICRECPAGRDRCKNAVHLHTHTLDYCSNSRVDRHKGFIDTTRKDGYCTRCAIHLATGTLRKRENLYGQRKEGHQT